MGTNLYRTIQMKQCTQFLNIQKICKLMLMHSNLIPGHPRSKFIGFHSLLPCPSLNQLFTPLLLFPNNSWALSQILYWGLSSFYWQSFGAFSDCITGRNSIGVALTFCVRCNNRECCTLLLSCHMRCNHQRHSVSNRKGEILLGFPEILRCYSF